MTKRPVYVTIIGWLYIITGVLSAAYQIYQIQAQVNSFPYPLWPIELLVGLSAVIAGAYVLRGRNWARWLALGWMAFHVAVSAFHSIAEAAMHLLFLAIIAWFLFRPAAKRYFQPTT